MFYHAYFASFICLEKIIGLDELVSVDDIKSIKLSLDSLVLDTIIMIPSYA